MNPREAILALEFPPDPWVVADVPSVIPASHSRATISVGEDTNAHPGERDRTP